MKEGDLPKQGHVFFVQSVVVLFFLIAAVILRTVSESSCEPIRLVLSNLIGDRGGYEDIVFSTWQDENTV